MSKLQPGPYLLMTTSLILVIAVVIASLLLLGRVVQGEEPIASNSLLSPVFAASGTTTIELVSVVPSATQTIVELNIEDLRINGQQGSRFFVFNESLLLTGFNGTQIYERGSKTEEGMQRVFLNLSPLLDFNSAAVIELKNLRRLDRSTGTVYDEPGPWRFEFDVEVPVKQRVSKRFAVDKELDVSGTTVKVVEMHISSTETRVSYEIENTQGANHEPLGDPVLTDGDQSYTGRILPEAVEGNYVVSFPHIAETPRAFNLSFPHFRSLIGPSVNVELNLPEEVRDSSINHIALDESITVAGRNLVFTVLDISPSNFSVSYQPADVSSSDLELSGPGAGPELIQVNDDLGNTYFSSGAVTTVSDGPRPAVSSQIIEFDGALNRQTSRLTISVAKTGLFSPNDFNFSVQIP